MTANGGPGRNRLAAETSPYLLQHAANPVDWYPWGEEAFARARAEDKAVFLSVGYSTCHWCHVMERESFEREEVAQVLNELFVCVKVDREERPDVDEIYMAATQLLTGRGGWPMSVWLTPDGRPFYAGTYFPREDRRVFQPGQGYGVQAGFVTVSRNLAGFWRDQRDAALDQAARITEAVREHVRMGTGGAGAAEGDLLGAAVERLRQDFDASHGGFSSRPKFPPHGALRLLLLAHERGAAPDALEMVEATLDGLARGGVHDHVGGGFHRYATDERWFLPHFEKMLYDNAQLAWVYAEAWRLTGNPRWRRVAERTLDWALREMRDPAGGFHSALDADSEGHEGTFYVWTVDEVHALLGPEEGQRFCDTYGLRVGGNWQDEASREAMTTNIPSLAPGVADDDLAAARETLYQVRARRVWPHLDDKVLTSWNGLMIGALARAGHDLEAPRYVDAARETADFVLRELVDDEGRLLATWRAGQAKLRAYLDDYAFLAVGLLELHAVTAERRWLDAALGLVGTLREHFADPDGGGFYFTADDHEALLVRSKSAIDHAIPSGNAMAALALARLAVVTGDAARGAEADRLIACFGDLVGRYPRAAETLVLAWATRHEPPVTATARVTPATLAPGGEGALEVSLRCAPGWHVQAARPSLDHLVATSVSLATAAAAGVALADLEYPAGEQVEVGGDALRVYGGETTIRGTLRVAADADPGVRALRLEVVVQPCDDQSCRRRETLTVAASLLVSEPVTG